MRHTIVAIMRGDGRQVYTLSEVSFEYHKHKYGAVRRYGDGLTSYRGPYNLTLPPIVYIIPESHPFFNIGVMFNELRYNGFNDELPVKDLSNITLLLNYFKGL